MSLANTEAIVTLAVSDVDAAKKFYEGTLGLQPTPDQEDGALSYQAGKATIFVYPSQYAGTNQATAVTWNVKDVDGLVKELKGKGVTFEHYPDLPDTKIEGDIHVAGPQRLAWFKDPDGNIHALAGGM